MLSIIVYVMGTKNLLEDWKRRYNTQMSNLKQKLKTGGIIAVAVIIILALDYGLSWIVTCGIIKLITMCFGLTFK